MRIKTAGRRLVALAMMVSAVASIQILAPTAAHAHHNGGECIEDINITTSQFTDLWWGNTMNSDASFTRTNHCVRVTTKTKSDNWFNGFRGHVRITLHNAWGWEIFSFEKSYLVGARAVRYDTAEVYLSDAVVANTASMQIHHWGS